MPESRDRRAMIISFAEENLVLFAAILVVSDETHHLKGLLGETGEQQMAGRTANTHDAREIGSQRREDQKEEQASEKAQEEQNEGQQTRKGCFTAWSQEQKRPSRWPQSQNLNSTHGSFPAFLR